MHQIDRDNISLSAEILNDTSPYFSAMEISDISRYHLEFAPSQSGESLN